MAKQCYRRETQQERKVEGPQPQADLRIIETAASLLLVACGSSDYSETMLVASITELLLALSGHGPFVALAFGQRQVCHGNYHSATAKSRRPRNSRGGTG
jgi:hypothetical protein